MLHPVMSTTFEDIHESDNVAVNVGVWIFKRVSHPGLSCKIDDDIEFVLRKQLSQRFTVFQIKTCEGEIRILSESCEPIFFKLDIIVIVEVVEPDNFLSPFEQLDGNVGTDESSSTCYEIFRHDQNSWIEPLGTGDNPMECR